MRHASIIIVGLLLILALPALAQTFEECADLNDDGTVNVGDLVRMIDVHRGLYELLPGTGDIDLRQGFNQGDFRYLAGYLFYGWPEGGCPPFDPYPLLTSDDTLYLPSADVPAGSGQLSLPIIMINQSYVTDLLLPMTVTGLDANITFDSLFLNPVLKQGIFLGEVEGAEGLILAGRLAQGHLTPGFNVIASAHFTYSGHPGGAIAIDTASPRPETYAHYLFKDGESVGVYEDYTIAVPTIMAIPGGSFPSMSVDPDSLFFQTLAGYPDPDPQYFSVLSDGQEFDWYSAKPDWIGLDPEFGISGESVSVTPLISGMNPGTYYADIYIYSLGAIGSPQKVVVKLVLKSQFPSLDANCDGIFNVSDVVMQINYIFGSGTPPCDPCTGEW